MEVSSHALELNRTEGIHFAAAVFTNLTQDHLDFHPTMEDYFLAKRRLFQMDVGARIVNVDDPYGRRLAEEFPDAVTFAIDQPADYQARQVRTDFAGSSFTIQAPDGPLAVRIALPGRFNVSNALAAVAAARALDVGREVIAAAMPEAGRVPGRFEPVQEGQDFAVLVDYAHTPDSLENVLRAARDLAEARVLVVFGCGGDRDRGKRPLMGRIARDLADVAIVTSDNPRSEDPEAIIREILEGAGADTPWLVDRRAAIERAVGEACAGDVVVIAGKGHEQG
jgi:UDP-N-acetylmuramoyl-L-alanyl-D-glutamate--2,6-diaminopimelate ligase